MVDLVGHLAIALLWVLPVWFLWEARLSVAFVALALVAAPVPDVDVFLPIARNGATHSISFVVVVALTAGAAIAVVAERALTRWWFEDEGRVPARSTLYVFAAGGLFVGGVSHLVGDLLGSTSTADGVAVLWPALGQRFSTASVEPLGDLEVQSALLVVALTVHVGLFVVERESR